MKSSYSYADHEKHFVAVDCVIFGYEHNALKVLLYPRSFEPSAGKWSLLGGFVGADETLDDAARRVLFKTTGLENIYLEQVYTFSKPDRDPAGRVISVTYFALIRIKQQDNALVKEHGAKWWPVSKLPKLIFDHGDMVKQALGSLQSKARTELIGHELLGDMFTITNLKNLYEALFLRNLDAGNFRKKVLSLGVLERTSEKDKAESKKGAFLYRYVQPDFQETIKQTIIHNP
jgi:8-oxo-dGTP diphosphatase